jgi:2-deoxy-D-gluconate 3-dehydrogenase
MTQKLLSVEGEVALITGANGGLGWAMAAGLRVAGALVAVTGRNEEKNRAIARELGDPHAVIPLDVRREEAVERAVAQVLERFGHLDVLVNNAGNFRGGSVLNMPREDWTAVVETHLTGSYLCAKHASRAMVERGEGGKIINIGSMYSLYGPPSYANYAAAKSGILGLTRALAVELAAHRIQVNAILPGWFETALTSGAPPTEWGERIRRKTPAGRWGNLEDLVGAVVFFASKASDFVSGTALPVDGGYAVADRLLPE